MVQLPRVPTHEDTVLPTRDRINCHVGGGQMKTRHLLNGIEREHRRSHGSGRGVLLRREVLPHGELEQRLLREQPRPVFLQLARCCVVHS